MTSPITVDKRKLINILVPLLKDSATLKALMSIGSAHTWDDSYFAGCVYEARQDVLDADIVDSMEEVLKEIGINA